MTNSALFGTVSSVQASSEDAGKHSVLDQSGQLGERSVTGNNNNTEHAKPLFTSGFEGEQSARGSKMESKGKSQDGELSVDSPDTFQNFGKLFLE